MSEVNELDFSILDGYEPEKDVIEDWYDGDIDKINPSKSGFSVIVKVTNYSGTKEGGAEAIGKEVSKYYQTKFSDTAPDWSKKNSAAELFELCKATDVEPAKNLDPNVFLHKPVRIAIEKKPNKFGKLLPNIKYFEHP